MIKCKIKDFNDLPLFLTVEDLITVLGISRVSAYNLVNSSNFPSIRINRRFLIPKENLMRWISEQTDSNNIS